MISAHVLALVILTSVATISTFAFDDSSLSFRLNVSGHDDDEGSNTIRNDYHHGAAFQEDQHANATHAIVASNKRNSKPPTKQLFRKNFFLVLDGIPHNWCMRPSDMFCLVDATKSVLDKNLKWAGLADVTRVHDLTIQEVMCGRNFVMFPRPHRQMFEKQFEFGGPPNHDDNEDGAMLGRTRSWLDIPFWEYHLYTDEMYYGWDWDDIERNMEWMEKRDDERHERKKKNKRRNRPRGAAEATTMQASSSSSRHHTVHYSKLWYGGAEMTGECADEGCRHLWGSGGKNDNKLVHNGGAIEAVDLQEALCAQLTSKCGHYFANLKHCRIVFGGKRARFPEHVDEFGDDGKWATVE